MLTHLDLFSGIGGFALAARWAGLKTIQFVEIDPYCQKVLAKNFQGVPIHDDIKTFTYTTGIRPFLLTGGFPCQPFSCAGKRRGKEDDRHLWPEMLRVISEARPTWIIGENVAGFVNMELDNCVSDLEREGYEVQAFIIPACAQNAPHRRDRVWIVANCKCHRFNGETISIQPRESQQEGYMSSREDCHAPDSYGKGSQRWNEYGKCTRECTTRTSSSEHWQEDWYTVALRTCVRGMDDGLSNRVDRLKSLGNAIVPQIAHEIIKAIIKTEKEIEE